MIPKWMSSFIVLLMCCGYITAPPFPAVKFEVLYPRGFQVSIPADEGILFFRIHVKLNEEIATCNLFNYGIKNEGRFIYGNTMNSLKIGDVIYYCAQVYYLEGGFASPENVEYQGKYIVNGYVNKTGSDITWRPPTTSHSTEACTPSVTVVNGVKQQCAEQLVFNEQFINFDTNKWTKQHRFSGSPDYEFVTYMPDDNVLYTRGNKLIVKPKWLTSVYDNSILKGKLDFGRNCTGEIQSEDCVRQNEYDILPPIISGQITTKEHFNFLYGTVLIRAKVPNIKWAFPQLYLEPVKNSYGKANYSSGQMRVAFNSGNDPCSLTGGIILFSDSKFRRLKICETFCTSNEKWSSDFHIYSLKWTPDLITVSVDGKEYCEINPGRGFGYIQTEGERIPTSELLNGGSKMAPFDHAFFLTIGLGVGGHYDFSDEIADKPWSNLHPRAMRSFWNSLYPTTYPYGQLIVDYVQVFTV